MQSYKDIQDGNCGIYAIRNTQNGKRYVGQSHNIRIRWYVHKAALRNNRATNLHLQYAWNKYGEKSFVFEIVELCDVDNLDKREEYWIAFYNTINAGYNIRPGGHATRGWPLSDAQKQKIRERLRNRTFTKEHCANISKAKKAYYMTHTAKTSKPIVCLNTGEIFENSVFAVQKYPTSDKSAIHHCCKGELLSSGKGENGERLVWVYYDAYKSMSKEAIDNCVAYANVHKPADAIRKRVICLNTSRIFSSCKEAALYYNISASNLIGCLRGRQKTAGKGKENGESLYWAYCD